MGDSPESSNTDNLWILVPLAALSIPIIAVLGSADNWVVSAAVVGLMVLIAVTFIIRSLMTHRHNLRMRELEAQERIAHIEQQRLTAAERLLERDDGVADLRDAVRRNPADPETGPALNPDGTV